MKYVLKTQISFGQYLQFFLACWLFVILTLGTGIIVLPVIYLKFVSDRTVVYDTIDERKTS